MAEEIQKCPMAEAVEGAYRLGEEDEALEPRVLVDKNGDPIGRFRGGDSVIFYDLRGEREIELCRSFLERPFPHFPVEQDLHLNFVTMIPYDKRLPARVAYSPELEVRETLSEILSKNGLRQVKISESEKAIHVSYFLNGKNREPFPGEERIAVPSFKEVPFFDQKPEMNAAGVADAVIQNLGEETIDFIFVNFANIDVVGHIENEKAIQKAVEAVDYHLGRVLMAAKRADVLTLVTADHGTAERWLYPDGSIDTGHTDSPVPFILIDSREETRFSWKMHAGGELADVGPTVLQILGLPRPLVMTGKSLILQAPSWPHDGKKRVLLILLDGWGHRAETHGNLIASAHTPTMDHLQANYPFITLEASGEAVGLSPGTVGNSEVGHLHIGAGRRIHSDRVIIDRAIQDGSFFQNEAFLSAMEGAKRNKKNLHLLGIVSFFSSHGSVNHLLALLKMAKRVGVEKVFQHAMLGRRGEHKESGARYIRMIEEEMVNLSLGKVVSVIGRYWSLDREENWERIEKTYRLLVSGIAKHINIS